MANDPAFLFYPGDYLRDTQCLSESVQVAYDRIMCEHMRNICISHQQLKFFTKKLSADEVEELKMVLTENAEGFQITWVAESIIKRKAYSQSRRDNRIKKPTTKDVIISETYDKHMENENEIVNESKNTNAIVIEVSDEKKFKENSFITFWDLYDKKVGLKDCEKKFLNLSNELIEKILEVVPAYVKSTPDKQYRKAPLVWINGQCWNDEIIKRSSNGESKSNAEIFHDAVTSEIGRGFSYGNKNN